MTDTAQGATHSLKAVRNQSVADGVFTMELSAPQPLLSAAPGQFVYARVDGFLLRRPFGIHSVDAEKGTITVAYAVRGKGTHALSRLKPGAALDVLGPLGHGFRLPEGAQHVLLVGGGMGAAPLLHAAQWLKGRASCDIALGFAGKGQAFSLDAFARACRELHIAADDGSMGLTGSVCELLVPLINARRPDTVWACGPAGLYRALQRQDILRGLDCQISLEERMGCGVGACLTCNCKVKDGDGWAYKRVCADGPVFGLWEVLLDGE
jgi:dihydroorotate dehydrogenase electron transfer subunit